MMGPARRRRRASALASIAVLTLPLIGICSSRPSRALPLYSRRYQVPCETCHTVAPRLTKFGLAFQANHFRWPGGEPPANRNGLSAVPISGLATATRYQNTTEHLTSSDFNTLELFASNGFTLGAPERSGGYFVDYFAIVKQGQAGGLEDAFVSVPLAGPQGQLAVTVGQFSPMSYQYDPVNSLTQSLPAALNNGVDAFSLLDAAPGLRLEYYDRRGASHPDGTYVSIGVPFEGQLELNNQSRLYSTTHGVYAHVFHRWGLDSLGLFQYAHSGSHLTGVLGTKAFGPHLQLLAGASTGRDAFSTTDNLSLQADLAVNSSLALTGRLDSERATGFSRQTFPAEAITFYPFRLKILRITGEAIQAPGNRSVAAYAFGQF